ncbi:MAG TPA: isoprenylcysteine carboxylmethyltransferase family protein [Selenomonadales bacterium]|nr:isoprenylcysteine carboxylmethyltransferase family protein [Selenomonadales bacterium]
MVKWVLVLAGIVIIQRSAELWLAARNKRWVLAQGGVEFASGHYPLFILLHSGWLAGWVAEAAKQVSLPAIWPLWLLFFLAAQGLRYWCIFTLGRRWNTRILVIPGHPPVRQGPYRYLRHPNYLAVSVELACAPLIFGAWHTCLIASLLNAWLLFAVRIPAEERALNDIAK